MNISKKCIEISLIALAGITPLSCAARGADSAHTVQTADAERTASTEIRAQSENQHIIGYGPDYTTLTGVHCESSAMLNALTACGCDITEEMIIGGGAVPSFMYLKGSFPFIGGRNLDMRQQFFKAAGIEHHFIIPETKDSMRDIAGVLARKIPVVLRVDMRFLPYRYNGKYGPLYMSFGSHYITIFGIDTKRNIAFVSDTEFEGMQTIELKSLEKARFSTTKNFPPLGEYYWAEPAHTAKTANADRASKSDDTGAADAVRLSSALLSSAVNGIIRNYENGALENLKNFAGDIEAFESYSKSSFMYAGVFSYMANTIDKNGTGGACFRIPFRRYMQTAAQTASSAAYVSPAVLDALDGSVSAWNALSERFRKLSAAAAAKKASKEEREQWYKTLAADARALYEAEKNLYEKLVDMKSKMDAS